MDGLYNIRLNGDTRGPFTDSQLRSMWNSGALTADAIYSRQGEDDWHLLAELCESKQHTHPPADATAPVEESSKLAINPTPARKSFEWSTFFWIASVSIGIYLLYATDGCEHAPELPNISKGSRDAPVSLHSSEIPKLTGGASFYLGSFSADLYNGSEWTIARVDVIITKKKNETSEYRRFQLSPVKIVERKTEAVPANPFSEGHFKADIGDFLNGAQQGEWTWNIIEVFGFRQ